MSDAEASTRAAAAALAEPAAPGWPAPATRRWFVVLLGLLLGVITWLALSPAPPRTIDTGWDKSNHLLAFAVLMFCAEAGNGVARWRRTVNALALLAYGVLIEVLQAHLPPRSGDWRDLLADAAGIALGAALFALVLGSRRSPR